MPPKLADRYRSTFGHAMVGAALLWAALPPWDLWPLAWIAPVWWVLLIRKRELPGRRPYRAIYLAGFIFWMAAFHWVRLPFWANAFLWVLAAFYQGFYLPVFVGLARVAVHRLRVPVILAAPAVWTGLELARGHLVTGTTMANLGHSQYRWIQLIQISDLAGAYGVSFVVMLLAACLGRMIRCEGKRWAVWPLVPAAAVLGATLLYGHLRTRDEPTGPVTRIALIQGSIDSEFKYIPHLREMIHEHYLLLSQEAVRRCEDLDLDLDLIVWPETMYRHPWVTVTPDARMPAFFEQEINAEAKTPWTHRQIQEFWETQGRDHWRKEVQADRQAMTEMARKLGVPLILGLDSQRFGPDGQQSFNAVVCVPPAGEIQGPYHKMHLVLFGEYIPLAEYFPWLYNLAPMSGLTAGEKPVAFELGELRLTPNICYESVMPNVVRRHANEARPDVLLNLTNDGWFWGSSELVLHLICGVFRAVECRKPFLIAANTGISAWIDADGRIRARGPRRHKGPLSDDPAKLTEQERQRRSKWSRKYELDWPKGTAKILAEVRLDHRESWYLRWGDWPAGVCLAACVVFAAAGIWPRLRRRKSCPAKD